MWLFNECDEILLGHPLESMVNYVDREREVFLLFKKPCKKGLVWLDNRFLYSILNVSYLRFQTLMLL